MGKPKIPVKIDVSGGKPAGNVGLSRQQCESMYEQLGRALGKVDRAGELESRARALPSQGYKDCILHSDCDGRGYHGEPMAARVFLVAVVSRAWGHVTIEVAPSSAFAAGMVCMASRTATHLAYRYPTDVDKTNDYYDAITKAVGDMEKAWSK